MAELSAKTHRLLEDIVMKPRINPPHVVKTMTFEELNNVVELTENDLDGWDFGVNNASLLVTAITYCKSEKRKLVKAYVFALDNPDPYDIELYALEFGFPYSKAKALVKRNKKLDSGAKS